MKDKKINQKIINLRALAILLVVFGHSIILYSSNWNLYETERVSVILDNIKNIINIVQMPLFFSISGYLFYSSYKKRNIKELFLEKFKRLIIPFLIISVFWMVPVRLFLNYAGYANLTLKEVLINKVLLGQDSGHMWFLPTLFYIFLIMKLGLNILDKIKNKIQYYVLAFTLAFAGILILFGLRTWIGKYYSYINNILSNFIYFYLGFGINKYKIEEVIHNHKILKVSLIIFNIVGIIISLAINNKILQILLGLSTVIVLYVIMPDFNKKLTNILSENSFGIYLLHSPLIYITFTYLNNASPILVVFLNFGIWGLCALGITMGLRRTKLKFIVGEK